MTWFQGTATDFEDLINELEQIATASNATAVLNAGGTGYSVGDILTVVGGTFTHAAQFEVVTLSGSAVATFRTYSGGAYSVTPGSGAATTVSPSGGTGCTLDMTLVSTGWERQRYLRQRGPTVAAIVAGGTGYSVDDVITVTDSATTSATLRVTAESAGVITGIAIEESGEYTTAQIPSNPVSVTGPGNDDATFDLTFTGTEDRDELILKGIGSGSDEIFVGLNSYTHSPASATNWELAGFSGYTAALTWENQPGKSPGEFLDQVTFQGGSYMALANTTMTYWLSISTRRITMAVKAGSTYSSMYMGLLNSFATTTEFPYPLYIAGQTSDHEMAFNSSPAHHSSISDPIAFTTGVTHVGPGQIRNSAGTWVSVRNSRMSGATRQVFNDYVVYPAGQPVGSTPNQAPVAVDDQVVTNGPVYWTLVIPNSGTPGSQSTRLLATENSTGDLSVPVPCTVLASELTDLAIWGEMDGVFWISADQSSTIISEDTVTIGSDRYKIFQSGPRTELFTFFCLKEA